MKFDQIGDRSAKCYSVTIGEHSGKVGAADEGEAIRLFRLHHSIETTTPPIVEAAEFDPEPEAKKTRAKRTPKADKVEGDKADEQQSEGSEGDSSDSDPDSGSGN